MNMHSNQICLPYLYQLQYCFREPEPEPVLFGKVAPHCEVAWLVTVAIQNSLLSISCNKIEQISSLDAHALWLYTQWLPCLTCSVLHQGAQHQEKWSPPGKREDARVTASHRETHPAQHRLLAVIQVDSSFGMEREGYNKQHKYSPPASLCSTVLPTREAGTW